MRKEREVYVVNNMKEFKNETLTKLKFKISLIKEVFVCLVQYLLNLIMEKIAEDLMYQILWEDNRVNTFEDTVKRVCEGWELIK